MFVFGVLAAAAAAFELTKPKEGQLSTSRDFLRFRTNYIVVYSLMMGEQSGPLQGQLAVHLSDTMLFNIRTLCSRDLLSAAVLSDWAICTRTASTPTSLFSMLVLAWHHLSRRCDASASPFSVGRR